MELLEALARSKEDENKRQPPANPFVSLYDTHPELELERTNLAEVSANMCVLICM